MPALDHCGLGLQSPPCVLVAWGNVVTKWGKIALFVAGALVGGFVEWSALHQPSVGAGGEEPWALPDFQYFEYNPPGAEAVFITGTLIGDHVGYSVNTWNIHCIKSDSVCRVADVEEIGRRQLGEINVADWPVSSWTPTTIVAVDTLGPTQSCARNTITIDRRTKTVRFLSEPVNSDSDFCTKGRKLMGPPAVEDWRIGNPKQPWGGYLGGPKSSLR